MRLTEFFKKIDMSRLDELFIRYKSDGTNRWEVVAHQQNVWLFDYNEWSEVFDDISQMTGIEAEEEARERPDILTGSFDGHVFYVEGDEDGMDPRVSTYIKKVAQFLGAEKVEMYSSALPSDKEIEDNVELFMYQVGKGVPDYAYHGTNSTAIPGILRFGLDPSKGTGNWDYAQGSTVGKFDLNFLTTRYATALTHAHSSARKQGGFPVVLKVKIPDRNQIGPDYDVALATGISPELADQIGYSGSEGWHTQPEYGRERQKVVLAKSGQNVWKQTGIFSYRGRIPANHIVEIQADLSGEMGEPEDMYYGEPMYTFDSLEEFKQAYELYRDYEYWHPDMEEEIEAMRAEEDEDEDDINEIVGGSQAGAGDDSSEYEEFVLQWGQPDMPHGNTHY